MVIFYKEDSLRPSGNQAAASLRSHTIHRLLSPAPETPTYREELQTQGMKFLLADYDAPGRPWPCYRDEHTIWQ